MSRTVISTFVGMFTAACFMCSFFLFTFTEWEIPSYALGWLCVATSIVFAVEGAIYNLSQNFIFGCFWLILGLSFLL